MSIDDIISFLGVVLVVTGVYLAFGLPAALVLFGVVLIVIGVWYEPEKDRKS